MSHDVPTVNVKPWGEDQGEFVVINVEDFDPAVHTMHEEAPAKPKKGKPAADEPAAEAGEPEAE